MRRYPKANNKRRRQRLIRTVRAYSEATGATPGSIIAAIIRVHMPTKVGSDRPVTLVIMPMPRATSITASQANAPVSARAVA
jgi:hypothetical protein